MKIVVITQVHPDGGTTTVEDAFVVDNAVAGLDLRKTLSLNELQDFYILPYQEAEVGLRKVK